MTISTRLSNRTKLKTLREFSGKAILRRQNSKASRLHPDSQSFCSSIHTYMRLLLTVDNSGVLVYSLSSPWNGCLVFTLGCGICLLPLMYILLVLCNM